MAAIMEEKLTGETTSLDQKLLMQNFQRVFAYWPDMPDSPGVTASS